MNLFFFLHNIPIIIIKVLNFRARELYEKGLKPSFVKTKKNVSMSTKITQVSTETGKSHLKTR